MKFVGVVILTSALSFGACQTSPKPSASSNESPTAINSIELYMSRASLLANPEFEQYKLVGDKLFGECGRIKAGRHYAVDQNVSTLLPEKRTELAALSAEVLDSIKDEASFRPPGKNAHFADPGKLTIKIKSADESYKLESSLDGIATGSGSDRDRVLHLVEAMRGATTQELCHNPNFYGIKR